MSHKLVDEFQAIIELAVKADVDTDSLRAAKYKAQKDDFHCFRSKSATPKMYLAQVVRALQVEYKDHKDIVAALDKILKGAYAGDYDDQCSKEELMESLDSEEAKTLARKIFESDFLLPTNQKEN